MSQETAINANDIVSTLQAHGMLKYWKGKHLVLKKQVSATRCDTGTFFQYLRFLPACFSGVVQRWPASVNVFLPCNSGAV